MSEAGARVVIGYQVRLPTAPPAADTQAYPVVGLDVADVIRRFTVVRDQPELVADEASADRGPPRQAALAAGRLNQDLTGQASGDRVRDSAVEGIGPAPFAIVVGRHDPMLVETGGLVKSGIVTFVQRVHTGRRRNEAARDAILAAAGDLLNERADATVSIAAIAQRAGVGKQTIYRWWPAKSAVLLEAMVRRASIEVPMPDSGDLRADVEDFLRATFAAAPAYRSLLLGTLYEALGDPATFDELRAFTDARRAALADLLQRAAHPNEIERDAAIELMLDQAFGVLWYRLIFRPERLDNRAAHELADALLGQLANAGGKIRA